MRAYITGRQEVMRMRLSKKKIKIIKKLIITFFFDGIL